MKEIILAPIAGRTLPLSEVMDPIFSEEIVGKGIAILPFEDRLCSPVKGKVIMVAKSKYAVTVKSIYGATILMHIGIDTCRIKEDCFHSHVSVGDEIEVGDCLIEFDRKYIAKKGYDIITPIIITNYEEYENIEGITGETLKQFDDMVYLIKKI